MRKEKRLIGDYGSSNTFTIYKGKDNSGNETIRIGTSDDSTTGLAFLLLLVVPPALIYFGIKHCVKKYKENKYQKEAIAKYEKEFCEKHNKKCK